MTSTEQPQFANAFGAEAPEMMRPRTGSRDYSNTAEWDASKTPPSRFQKRKGSIYATPSSRDGHVERNRDAVEDFHRAHSKRWSISSAGSSTSGSAGGAQKSTLWGIGGGSGSGSGGGNGNENDKQDQQRRKSSASGGGAAA